MYVRLVSSVRLECHQTKGSRKYNTTLPASSFALSSYASYLLNYDLFTSNEIYFKQVRNKSRAGNRLNYVTKRGKLIILTPAKLNKNESEISMYRFRVSSDVSYVIVIGRLCVPYIWLIRIATKMYNQMIEFIGSRL